MIRVLLSERIQKTAGKLPPEVRKKAPRVIADVAAAFGDPHRHCGLGLRKLAACSYEIRVHLHRRIVFIFDGKALVACDVMSHDDVACWLSGQRK